MPTIEADRLIRSSPGSDQHAPRAQVSEMFEQCAADAMPLAGRDNVGMPDQIDIADPLDAHGADQRIVGLIAPEMTPAAISLSSSRNDMYGSCQQSSGITPR